MSRRSPDGTMAYVWRDTRHGMRRLALGRTGNRPTNFFHCTGPHKIDCRMRSPTAPKIHDLTSGLRASTEGIRAWQCRQAIGRAHRQTSADGATIY